MTADRPAPDSVVAMVTATLTAPTTHKNWRQRLAVHGAANQASSLHSPARSYGSEGCGFESCRAHSKREAPSRNRRGLWRCGDGEGGAAGGGQAGEQ